MRRVIFLLAVAAVMLGCEENEKTPADMRARQDAALRDPFNYSPDIKHSVGGGGTMDFDKDAFRRDVRNVLDP